MRHARTKLTPLTEEEQRFATDNHYMVNDFLRYNKLPENEWYDVVVFRYLHMIKNWHVRPELHKYPFVSLARRAMSSAVSNERKKQDRYRIRTVSLDGIVPGTEDLRLIDTITEENLKFVIYLEGEDMNISYDVIIPERRRGFGQKSDEIIAVESFLTTKKMKNMRIEYETIEEAKKKQATLRAYMRKNGLQDVIDIFRIDMNVYVERKQKKEGK